MTLGLDESEELAIAWRWRPLAPWPLAQALPQRKVRNDALFSLLPSEVDLVGQSESAHTGALEEKAEWGAYRAAFNRLAALTPDLRLYRLIRLFNAPLLSLSTRDAGHVQWAPWQGKVEPFLVEQAGEPRAHLWFFGVEGDAKATDADVVVLEYTFDAGLCLRADSKPLAYLHKRYDAICRRIRTPSALSASRVHTPPR